jgi:hypothetical protein
MGRIAKRNPEAQLSILHGYGAYSPSAESRGEPSFAVSSYNYMTKDMTKVVVA